jgi:hypothetical protein
MRLSPTKAAATLAALGLCLAAAGASGATTTQSANVATYKANHALSYVLGSKRAIGYFIPVSGECRVTLMIAEAVDPDVAPTVSAARVIMTIRPGQSAAVSSVEAETITLTCGADAQTMQVAHAASTRS